MAEIEYFYVPHGAYAYLGSARFLEIAKAAGRKVVHRPFDFARVVEGAGSTATRSRPAKHRAYFFGREIQRWAEYRNAPVVDGMPTYHWNDVSLAAQALIVANDTGEADALSHAFLEAHWRDDADLADRPTLERLIAGAGLDPAVLLAAADTDAVRARYEANTEEAIRRSVFGSPTYFVDGDMFYGQDRLELVERACVQPFKGTWPPAA